MRKSGAVLAVLVVSSLLMSCGRGGGASTREVLIDYRDDDFPSSFLAYYPRNVAVHPGDTVVFKQTWTGEPHSVTMGSVVDDFFRVVPAYEKYEFDEDAMRAAGLQATVDLATATVPHIPAMTDEGRVQPGAQPCYVVKRADIPKYSDENDNTIYGPSTTCPTRGRPQPAFTGRQALYNSGYIPWEGSGANKFTMKIAADATPGTYTYFCNYHWIEMSGTVKVVPKSQPVASGSAVKREALKEIRHDASKTRAAVATAKRKLLRATTKASASVDTGQPFSKGYVSANEFFPTKLTAKVGQPVTWTFQGLWHTVSFNVPAYFPVFSLDKKGEVHWDERAHQPVRWTVPEAQEGDGHNDVVRNVDVGVWDGSGGFHSSGFMSPGDTFTVRFSKPGTYPYACAVHPQMIGQVVVTA